MTTPREIIEEALKVCASDADKNSRRYYRKYLREEFSANLDEKISGNQVKVLRAEVRDSLRNCQYN